MSARGARRRNLSSASSGSNSNPSACRDISNVAPTAAPTSFKEAAKTGAWGAHVLNATGEGKDPAPRSSHSSLDLGTKLAGALSAEDFSTRTSLRKKKRRKKGMAAAASASFDTMLGAGDEGERPLKKVCSDPMARFDPDLSMDGFGDGGQSPSPAVAPRNASSFFGELNTEEVVRSKEESEPSSSEKSKNKFVERKPVNFLTLGRKNASSSSSARKVDEGWLYRCSDLPSAEEEEVSGPEEATKPSQADQEDMGSQEVVLPPKSKSDREDEDLAPGVNSEKEEEEGAEKRTREESAPGPADVYALGFEAEEEEKRTTKARSVTTRNPETREERLRKKLGSGNFVKINLKRKTYVKGKKTLTGAKYRRMEFKRKMAEKEKKSEKKSTCFRCGQEGHWANQCVGEGDELMPEPEDEEGDGGAGEFPTLEEAAAMARGLVGTPALVTSERGHLLEGVGGDGGGDAAEDEDEDDFLLRACSEWEPEEAPADSFDVLNRVPAYFADSDPDDECVEKMRRTLKEVFDFEEFRQGQTEAILRILRGQSTLVLLSTGAGKSLVYQLPAYLYGRQSECITLVVSPLVSLMEDQVAGLPPGLKAACLHSNQTETQRSRVVDLVKKRKLHFLLVSPEALAGGGGGGGFFASLIKDLPPIAFVCVDEAHCVSQWSHNFRPAYLRLCRVIRERLGVRTILGLTATAPESTIRDVAENLWVDAASGVVRGELMPRNLVLSVSKDEDPDRALIRLLHGERFACCDSIIVYCTRREVCERLAVIIRTAMQEEDLKKKAGDAAGTKGSRRKRLSLTAEAYHAGLSAYRRKTVQNSFMGGKLRVVVATVAFGMGIDKPDIRAVIHYNMPKTFESYIQEIGRAGRDGKPAHCHLFLSYATGQDLNELRRHIYANSVDEQTVRKLLDFVFERNTSDDDAFIKHDQKYKEVAVPLEKMVESLDLPEENISTLLCYLENDPKHRWIKLLNPVYSHCKVRCYGGPKQLRVAANKSPPLAAAIAIARKSGRLPGHTAQFEFPVVEVSARMGWDSGVVKRELKNLQWTRAPGGSWKKSGVLVEFSELALHFEAVRDLSAEDRDYLKTYLHDRSLQREKTELYDLQRVFRSFNSVASQSYKECAEEASTALSDKLKNFVSEYFGERVKTFEDLTKRRPPPLSPHDEARVKAEVMQFVGTHSDHRWHGRAVARVFHGIGSPCFPATQWGRVHRYWRSHLQIDFNVLCRLAREAILSSRGASSA